MRSHPRDGARVRAGARDLALGEHRGETLVANARSTGPRDCDRTTSTVTNGHSPNEPCPLEATEVAVGRSQRDAEHQRERLDARDTQPREQGQHPVAAGSGIHRRRPKNSPTSSDIHQARS